MRIPKKGEIWYIDPDPTKGQELRNQQTLSQCLLH